MKIAVAGGTGLAGRLVVEALRARGHAPVVLSRGQGVDLLSGAGLDAALAGAEAVVDVSNVTTTRGSVSVDFFDRDGTWSGRPVLPLYVPGGMSGGGLLPTGTGPRGTQTFADWLGERTA
ncbi:hypothetical protein AB0L10_00535 [Streptomyces flaveolus]|uniref:hypothetical protein n=1 Tax=Streptomyces flaveolus TaxID=67297 RepID=UPI003413E85B